MRKTPKNFVRTMQIIALITFIVFPQVTVARAQLEAVGKIEGSIHILPFTRAQVESLIPKELTVIGNQNSPDARHPVILFMGTQRDVHFVANEAIDFPNTLGDEYQELVLLIPNLESKKHPGRRFSYSPTMYLSRARATAAGYLYKFNKKLARFRGNDRWQTIESMFFAQQLFEHSYEGINGYNESQLRTNLSAISHLFKQPMYQSQGPGALCSYFNWKLDKAQVLPIRASVSLPAAFTGRLNALQFSQMGLDESPFASFYVLGDWTMTLPMPCNQF